MQYVFRIYDCAVVRAKSSRLCSKIAFENVFCHPDFTKLQAVLGLRRSRLTLFRGYERTP